MAAVSFGLALFLALTGAEITLRKLSPTFRRLHDPPHPFFQKHPTRGWILVPGYDRTDTWGIRFRVNSLGLRGAETTRHKPPGVYRVLVLGDSITMAAGLPEEAGVCARLAELLQARCPDRPIEVINGGIGGYDIEEEVRLMEEEGVALAPDAVILIVCLNDFPGLSFGDHINPLRDLPIPGKEWFLHCSALALALQELYHRIGLKAARLLSGSLRKKIQPPSAGWKQAGTNTRMNWNA